MPKNPAGRTDEEQKTHEKAQAKHQAWLGDEALRAVRGSQSQIYGTPGAEEQTTARAFLVERGIPIPGTKPISPTEIPEQPAPPELRLSEFLPPDILSQMGKNWYQGRPGQTGTGKPQTFEEQQFVLDYLAQYGMKPTAQRATQEGFQQTGTYDPTSTMGQMGFRNYDQYLKAQRIGEPYGPMAGSQVPSDAGIVITDAQGNPTQRIMDVNRPEAQKAIAEGRYINPITGEMAAKYQGGIAGGEPYYTKPMGQMSELSAKELIKQYGNPQMYLEGLSDHLDNLVGLDYPKIDAAYKEIEAVKKQYKDYAGWLEENYDSIMASRHTDFEPGPTPQEMVDNAAKGAQAKLDELNDQINNVFMTKEKSQREYAKAQDAVSRGTPLDQLPYFNEVTPTIAARSREEQQRQYGVQQAQQPAPWIGYAEEPEVVQGQTDIAGIINGLNTTPEYRRYLLNNIGYLRRLWQQSGEPDFYNWLLNYQGVK